MFRVFGGLVYVLAHDCPLAASTQLVVHKVQNGAGLAQVPQLVICEHSDFT